MQHLFNTKWNPYRNSSKVDPAWTADASSPFQKFVDDIDNKRAKLFPDRRRVPGRKTKYIVTVALLVQAYTVMKLMHAKKIHALKEEQKRITQRKMAPFFQSFEDMHYTNVKHRIDLILLEAFKGKGGESHLEKFNRFNQNKMWMHDYQFASFQGNGTGRFNKSQAAYVFGAYLPGYDIQNI